MLDERLLGPFPGGSLIGEEELHRVAAILRARSPYRFAGLDPQRACERLERALAERHGRRSSLVVSSGTAALHVALAALGVQAGDEVVIPTYAWSADLMAVLAVGATPVLAPIDAGLGLDPERLEACLSERTRAVVAVHMRGYPCDVDAIAGLLEPHGIPLVEDAAQCFGGSVRGRPVGSRGVVGVFSFQFNKLVTAGEGGALVLDDPALLERARCFHDLGMSRSSGTLDPEGQGAIAGFGLNYRLTELQAAVLEAQLAKLPRIERGLRDAFERVAGALKGLLEEHALRLRPAVDGAAPNHAFLCLSARDAAGAERALKALRQRGVPVQACGRVDPHHFRAWMAFLEREQRPYRLVDDERSDACLRRSLFLELRAA